jgi:hypothetical protein
MIMFRVKNYCIILKKKNFNVNHDLNKQFHVKQKNQFYHKKKTNDYKQR